MRYIITGAVTVAAIVLSPVLGLAFIVCGGAVVVHDLLWRNK